MTTRHLNQTDLAVRWNISHRTLDRWRRTGPRIRTTCARRAGRRSQAVPCESLPPGICLNISQSLAKPETLDSTCFCPLQCAQELAGFIRAKTQG